MDESCVNGSRREITDPPVPHNLQVQLSCPELLNIYLLMGNPFLHYIICTDVVRITVLWLS